jgi:hypothetical protein
MTLTIENASRAKPGHDWLRPINIHFMPGPTTPMLDRVLAELAEHFRRLEHNVQAAANDDTDVLITTAPYGKALGWRDAVLFTGRRRLNLNHTPTVFTLMAVTAKQMQQMLDKLGAALEKQPPDPADFAFPGLAPSAHRTLIEQGLRGGPIMAFIRLLQSQSMSIRLILIVGEEEPQAAYYFDLVGAHPRLEAHDPDTFYTDLVLRIATVMSTEEVTKHEVLNDVVPRTLWESLSTPTAMRTAGQQLGRRHFFTEMVRPADLVHVPAVQDAIASQYSEGCFATWDPKLNALIATVTGSARPVEKDNITDDELAVIVGVRPDHMGAIYRPVEAKRNDPPSSEAVEMMDMDNVLPRIILDSWNSAASAPVPVVRSKLHGHRGVSAYDPRYVEFAPLDLPYYHYPVSCATEAQARGIKAAFARSQAFTHPDDPRQVVFTVLPGHGVVIAEKWVPGTVPFQIIWEYMDAGFLQIANHIPQGFMEYISDSEGGHHLVLRT